MPATLARQRPRLGDACQNGKMATLLNSIFFVFEMLFPPNYRVKYYDYIVKWCSGITCNWCVSLDIAVILALPCDITHLSNSNDTDIDAG